MTNVLKGIVFDVLKWTLDFFFTINIEIFEEHFIANETCCKEEKPSSCNLSNQIKTWQIDWSNQNKDERKTNEQGWHRNWIWNVVIRYRFAWISPDLEIFKDSLYNTNTIWYEYHGQILIKIRNINKYKNHE
jgi:hypothetical protein